MNNKIGNKNQHVSNNLAAINMSLNDKQLDTLVARIEELAKGSVMEPSQISLLVLSAIEKMDRKSYDFHRIVSSLISNGKKTYNIQHTTGAWWRLLRTTCEDVRC